MKSWVVKKTDAKGLENVLNELTKGGYEVFAINNSPVPGFAFHEYVVSAYKEA